MSRIQINLIRMGASRTTPTVSRDPTRWSIQTDLLSLISQSTQVSRRIKTDRHRIGRQSSPRW
jgi:hypothetical protein